MNALRIYVDFALAPEVLALLREGTRGHVLIFPKAPAASVLAKADYDPLFATADVAFGQPDPAWLADAGRLKWIHISTSGITRYDNAPMRAFTASRRIPLTNSASVYREACALHAMSFLLAQSRHLPRSLQTRTPNGSPAWQTLRGSCRLLQGQTVLIIGYGAIGERLVELLRPLGVSLIAYRRQARGNETVPMLTTPDQLDRALAESADHVVNILPDHASTRGFFGRERLGTLKPGAVFYNIGRGTTVDQEALLAALRTQRLAAAWLDVTDPEPLPDDHPLRAEPNCFITPHVAGGHTDEAQTLVRHFLANFARFVDGQPLLDRVM